MKPLLKTKRRGRIKSFLYFIIRYIENEREIIERRITEIALKIHFK